MDSFLETLDTFQRLFRVKKRDQRKIRKADLDALSRLGKEQWFFVLNRDARILPELLGLLHLDGNVNKDDTTFWVYIQALIAQAEFFCFATPVVQHVHATNQIVKDTRGSAKGSAKDNAKGSARGTTDMVPKIVELDETDKETNKETDKETDKENDTNPFGSLITEIARDVEQQLQNPLEIQSLMSDMQNMLSGQGAPSAQLAGLIENVRSKIGQKIHAGELDTETLKTQSLNMLSTMSLGDLLEKKM